MVEALEVVERQMVNPPYGKIVNLVEVKKKKERDDTVYVGQPLDDILLRVYANAIDKLCCVECSSKRCRKRDGSCWVWTE